MAASDSSERRRTQNRAAQRKHRSTLKVQLDKLQTRNAALEAQNSAFIALIEATTSSESSSCFTRKGGIEFGSDNSTAAQNHISTLSPVCLGNIDDERIAKDHTETSSLQLALELQTESQLCDHTISNLALDKDGVPGVEVTYDKISVSSNIDLSLQPLGNSSVSRDYKDRKTAVRLNPLRADRSALHQAVANAHMPMLCLLVSYGADLNAQDDKGRTPLHECAIKGNAPEAQLLLNKGASSEVKDHENLTPLQHAVALGNVAVVQVLLQNGADVNARHFDDLLQANIDILEAEGLAAGENGIN